MKGEIVLGFEIPEELLGELGGAMVDSDPAPKASTFVNGPLIGLIVTAVLVIISIAVIVIAFFRSKSRGLFSTLVHVVNAACAVVWAGLIMAIIMPAVGAAVSGVMNSFLSGKLGSLETNQGVKDLMAQLPGALAAPFVFVVLFFIFKIIGDIVIFAVIRGKRKEVINFKGQKWVAGGVGILLAIVCLTVWFMPLAGTVRTTGEVMRAVKDSGLMKGNDNGEIPDSFMIPYNIITSVDNSFVLKVVDKGLGGGLMYNQLSSVSLNGKGMSLAQELSAISSIARSFAKLELFDDKGKLRNDIKPQDISEALRNISKEVGSAEITTTIIGEELGNAVDKWKGGESALGMKLMTGNDKVDELIGGMLACFDDTSSAKGISDVLTFSADVIEVLPDKALSTSDGSSSSSKELLSGIDVKGTVSLIGKTYENDTMREFTDTLVKWVLRRAAEAVEVNADEVIDKIDLSKYTSADIIELEDMLAEMIGAAEQFQEKLLSNEKLTQEENDILMDALAKLKANKIIGEAVEFIYNAAKEKHAFTEPAV